MGTGSNKGEKGRRKGLGGKILKRDIRFQHGQEGEGERDTVCACVWLQMGLKKKLDAPVDMLS